MNRTFDYQQLNSILINLIDKKIGIETIEFESNEETPAYPFATFFYKIPRIEVSPDIYQHEVFEMILMIDVFSDRTSQALNVAEQLRKMFISISTSFDLDGKKIVVVDTTSTTPRSSLNGSGHERRVGFDLRLRVKDSFEDDIPEIETVEISDANINIGGANGSN